MIKMARHFLNYTSALKSIGYQIQQVCNEFTLLHFITNGYLNIYFKYQGCIYKKIYNKQMFNKYNENDFTIFNTEYVDDFLRVKIPTLTGNELYQVIKGETELKVGNVHKELDNETYHLLKEGNHIPVFPDDKDEAKAYINLLLENEDIEEYIIGKNSNKRELIEINRYEFLTADELYFCSEEIESLQSPLPDKRQSNLIDKKHRDKANQVLVQHFANLIHQSSPELSKNEQAKIIALAMSHIKQPLSERTIRDQLKVNVDQKKTD